MKDFESVLSALLKGKQLNQPFKSSQESDYRKSLEAKLEEYIRRIENLKKNGDVSSYLKENIHEIRKINSKILASLDSYLSGSAGKAYKEIEELLNSPLIKKSLRSLTQDLKEYESTFHDIGNLSEIDEFNQIGKTLYRVRISNQLISNRQDIFHIPFDSRHLIETQRYSIAGLPCLYLGSSLYVCWQEMGRPNLDDLYLSRYRVNSEKRVNVLNFAFSLETLKSEYNKSPTLDLLYDESNKIEVQRALLLVWPILAACSFDVQYTNAKFTVEYIIPNLLLQWISKETGISGIKYLSTKTKQLRDKGLEINFVFPPSVTSIEDRYCKVLQNNFYWSKPVTWQVLDMFENMPTDETSPNIKMLDDVESLLVFDYNNTKFYRMEHKLHRLAKISNEFDTI